MNTEQADFMTVGEVVEKLKKKPEASLIYTDMLGLKESNLDESCGPWLKTMRQARACDAFAFTTTGVDEIKYYHIVLECHWLDNQPVNCELASGLMLFCKTMRYPK